MTIEEGHLTLRGRKAGGSSHPLPIRPSSFISEHIGNEKQKVEEKIEASPTGEARLHFWETQRFWLGRAATMRWVSSTMSGRHCGGTGSSLKVAWVNRK